MIPHGRNNRTALLLKHGVGLSLIMVLLAAVAHGTERPAATSDNSGLGISARIRLITRDSDTNETIPCRVVIADSLGRYWGLGGKCTIQRPFFYTPGDTLITLFPGTFRATVCRGFEYTPVSGMAFTVPVPADQTPITVEIPLRRWIHMKALGWYSCESEVHSEGSLDPRGIYTVQLGEDLNILNLAAFGEGNWTTEYQYWRRDPFPFSIPYYPMVVSEEWRSASWQNHMMVMGHSHPLSQYGNGFYEYPDCPYRFSYPPALDFCDEAHSLGAIVFLCHPFPVNQPWTAQMGVATERYAAFELPADVALGKIDGMEVYTYSQIDTWNRYVWYKLLNCGFRVPPFAGTDVLNFTDSPTPGHVRSYTYIPGQTGDLDVREWMNESVKGRSFVSSGAVVFFTVNGGIPGSELKLASSGGKAPVAVRADARWIGGIISMEIIVNGETVLSRTCGGASEAVLEGTVTLTRSSWIAAKVNGNPIDIFQGNAHSGPAYITLDDRPIRSREDALFFIDWIDRHIALLDSAKHFDTAAHRDRTFALYRQAQDVYRVLADTSIVASAADAPRTFVLLYNFPNPFNGETEIAFELPVKGRISVEVYDVLGRRVRTIFSGVQEAGRHTERINMENAASGLYFIRLSAPQGRRTQKMLLIR